MHINFQMIVLICMAAISCMLGRSVFQGGFRDPGSYAVSKIRNLDVDRFFAKASLEVTSKSNFISIAKRQYKA